MQTRKRWTWQYTLCEKTIAADKLQSWLATIYMQIILQEHNQLDEAATSLKRAIFLDPILFSRTIPWKDLSASWQC